MVFPTPQTHFSTQSGLLFDRSLIRQHRSRAAASFSHYSYLKDRVVEDLKCRIKFMRRSFLDCLDLGAHTGQLGKALEEILPTPIITTDSCESMLQQAQSPLKVVLDEESLPFAENSLDLVVSALSLHWINDVPGLLAQIYYCLKPDGLLLASLFGGETLIELRDSLTSAELELSAGVTPRLSPMISVKDAGGLLQRAGFALPVVDCDRIQVTYSHPMALLHDLRNMGESNALYHRSKAFMSRALLARMIELYQQRYGLSDGRVTATFDVVTLTGWKPHASQQIPLKRGSAKVRLNDYL
jgi:NADH dehydrogenase [ubiquinone] 1 alpha subcomplex assembly factor 5